MANIDREQKAFTGNKDHLAILLDALEKGDSRVWNDWRFKNPELPDLMGVNLSGVSLVNYNFSATAFDNANLTFADLTSCDLSGANFYHANMSKVKMFHASAYGGQFRKTNLTDADLSGSVFNSADFKAATLTGCKIHGIGRTGKSKMLSMIISILEFGQGGIRWTPESTSLLSILTILLTKIILFLKLSPM